MEFFVFRGGEIDGSFRDFRGGHLGRESAGADEAVELLFVFVFTGGFNFDMGGADGFMSFLSFGGFGFECADFKIVFAKSGFYIVRD